jgi:ubiquitin-conjugating enzyme E2 Z
MTERTISKYTITRLVKDIANMNKDPLHDQGIYYHHDDANILVGNALIIGPDDTPYQFGFYHFRIEYPTNYPHAPPKVIFLTNQDRIRFNPNLYRNGKCCLSILNTWSGDQWSSCQTLRSILLTLVTVFNKTPFLNEPAITEKHLEYDSYHKMIEYSNIKIAFLGTINHAIDSVDYTIFEEEIKQIYSKNLQKVQSYIKTEKWNSLDTTVYTNTLYNVSCVCNYKKIYDEVIKLN